MCALVQVLCTMLFWTQEEAGLYETQVQDTGEKQVYEMKHTAYRVRSIFTLHQSRRLQQYCTKVTRMLLYKCHLLLGLHRMNMEPPFS